MGKVLGRMRERERKGKEMRVGRKGEERRRKEEGGKKVGVTRESRRKREAKTLVKLKSYRESQRLKEFLE